MQLLSITALALILTATQTWAAERFEVVGDTIVYRSIISDDADKRGVNQDDVVILENLLDANPQVTTLEITSSGGNLYAAINMLHVVDTFGLDTRVTEYCESACPFVFIAGVNRTMAEGARLGFHLSYREPEELRAYYVAHKAEEDWTNAFEFASYMFEEGQRHANDIIPLMYAAGLSAEFIHKANSSGSYEMWHPSREELMAGGVITE
jgi:hypothetical protein